MHHALTEILHSAASLRGAGITRWRANVPIICDGNLFFQDIAMDDRALVIEIDGKQHMDPTAADYDRWRGTCSCSRANRYSDSRRSDWTIPRASST